MRRTLALLLAAALPALAPAKEPAPPPQPAPAAQPVTAPRPDPTYLPELQARARERGLAATTAWLRLGHWRAGLWGGFKSEADGPAFFLAEGGKTDPAAELQATLAGLFDDTPRTEELDDAQCRFPARFTFLVRELGVDLGRLPPRPCARRDEFVGRVMASGVTLVFSSWYLNNPASAFGHTFLRLDKAGEALGGKTYELLDTGVDYSAQVDTNNAVAYALKGLFGLFRGTFNHYAYYYKVREYADYESRDLWEYDLALTPAEVALLALHLWELGGTWFDYWYLDENCSYHVLGALEAAAPRLELLRHVGRFVVLPSDSVQALFRNPGLVRSVHYRPSIRTQLEARVARLGAAGTDLALALADDAAAPLPPGLPQPEAVGALDAAVDLVDVRHGKAILMGQDEPMARRRQALLERRAALPVASPPLDLSVPEQRRPDLGHRSGRLEVGGGASRRDGALLLLDVRLAFHDLLDPAQGYPRTAQIEFADLRLRWAPRPRRLELDEGWLVRITSLSAVTRLEARPSWKARFGAATVRDQGCPGCLVGDLEVGGGLAAMGLLGAADLVATGDVELQGAPGLSGFKGRGVRIGAGPGGLLRVAAVDRLALAAEARWRWWAEAAPRNSWLLRAEARAHLTPRLSLAIEVRRVPRDDEALALVHLFY